MVIQYPNSPGSHVYVLLCSSERLLCRLCSRTSSYNVIFSILGDLGADGHTFGLSQSAHALAFLANIC